MRNETLKNLLLTASLISASAFLTACGDTASDTSSTPAEPTSQPEQRVKDALETLQIEEAQVDDAKRKAMQVLREAQQAAGEEVKVEVDQFLKDFEAFDSQLPAKVEKASADAMIKAKKAYLNFETSIPQALSEAEAFMDAISFPTIVINKNLNLINLNDQITSLTKTLDGTKDLSIADQKEKLTKLLSNRVELKDAYLKEVIAYYSASNYGTEADITKRDELITSITQNFIRSQAQISATINKEIIKGLGYAAEQYNNRRQQLMADIANLKKSIDEINKAGADQTQRYSLSWSLEREFFGTSPKYTTTALFRDNWDKYYLSVKDKLAACSMTKSEFITDFLDKFKTYIHVHSRRDLDETLDELSRSRPQAEYQQIIFILKRDLLEFFSLDTNSWKSFFKDGFPGAPAPAAALSAGTIKDLSSNTSLRQARTAATGSVDGSAFKMNGVAGQSIDLGMPLFVQLKGDVSSSKSTDAATGSVAYRLGNTVIGAIQGYANSGADFGIDSRQLETSVVASHSFGAFFVEGQVGTVSATEVHNSNWSGLRSQVTLGLDTEFVSPFVQLAHRQLDRSGLDLNETTTYVGLDAEVAKLAADTYSIDTRLLTKVGYGSKNWSANSKDLGSTTGFSGSVEWSSSLNLNSGVTFSSNLALDTLAGSSAAVNVSLDR